MKSILIKHTNSSQNASVQILLPDTVGKSLAHQIQKDQIVKRQVVCREKWFLIHEAAQCGDGEKAQIKI